MSVFACLAESRIQEFLERGEGTSLAGLGAPLDLEGYFAAPAALRAGLGVLKSAGIAPPEVESMKLILSLREQLASTTNPAVVHLLKRELLARETELAMAMERMKRSLRSDATGS